MRLSLVFGSVLAAGLVLAACGRSGSKQAAAPAGAPPAWLLASMPEGAVTVGQAKPGAKEGDAVVLRGCIGGREDPMSKDAAVFIMMDPSVPSCAGMEGDACKTPWDYCCESPETITANSATVQVVDAAGAPLAIDLTRHGLQPLDEVVVVGTVGPRPTPEVLTIRATRVHRVGRAGG